MVSRAGVAPSRHRSDHCSITDYDRPNECQSAAPRSSTDWLAAKRLFGPVPKLVRARRWGEKPLLESLRKRHGVRQYRCNDVGRHPGPVKVSEPPSNQYPPARPSLISVSQPAPDHLPIFRIEPPSRETEPAFEPGVMPGRPILRPDLHSGISLLVIPYNQ